MSEKKKIIFDFWAWLAVLHTHIFPRAWLKDAKRIGMVAVTMGPLKQIRCLQVFKKVI